MTDMNWSKREAIGALHMFWWWCVDHAEDGDLRRYNDTQLANVVELNQIEAKKFVDSLVKSEFLERFPYFRVKNWWKYSKNFMKQRYKDSVERWKRIEQIYTVTVTDTVTQETNQQTNQPNKQNKQISAQIENLRRCFDQTSQETINKYLSLVKDRNKRKSISSGRELTLLTELFNTKARFSDEELFRYGIEQCVKNNAPNIGYINAVIRNQKAKLPTDR